MLKQVSAPKQSATKNLEDIFQAYPVITNESSLLKMDAIAEKEVSGEFVNGMNFFQQLFSQLMTSFNPFAQYVVRELAEGFGEGSKKHWKLDQNMMRGPQ